MIRWCQPRQRGARRDRTLRLTLERANEVFRNEPIFHSLVSR